MTMDSILLVVLGIIIGFILGVLSTKFKHTLLYVEYNDSTKMYECKVKLLFFITYIDYVYVSNKFYKNVYNQNNNSVFYYEIIRYMYDNDIKDWSK